MSIHLGPMSQLTKTVQSHYEAGNLSSGAGTRKTKPQFID